MECEDKYFESSLAYVAFVSNEFYIPFDYRKELSGLYDSATPFKNMVLLKFHYNLLYSQYLLTVYAKSYKQVHGLFTIDLFKEVDIDDEEWWGDGPFNVEVDLDEDGDMEQFTFSIGYFNFYGDFEDSKIGRMRIGRADVKTWPPLGATFRAIGR